MIELSIICPFVQEWPQVAFTVQSIAEELRDRVNFEIILIDNWCKEVEQQGRTPDRGHKYFVEVEKGHDWLHLLKYDKKLSHWQAKNMGVQASKGKFLWFCDAHCIVSRDALYKMFMYYKEHHEKLNGTLHLPLTYSIVEWRKLIYKLMTNLDKGAVHYSFSSYRNGNGVDPYRVPCMSTCGMMLTREIYDKLGGWPTELGIYGGGENFLNFTLAVLGKKVWIMPGHPLRHHGDKRGYHWNSNDYQRNRLLATYIFGGTTLAKKFRDGAMRGHPYAKEKIFLDVIRKCGEHRDFIKNKQVIAIEEWVAQNK